MQYEERYCFVDRLLPHGEDGVKFGFDSRVLDFSILYDNSTKSIDLRFEGCAYQYFAPLPGYHPEQFLVHFPFKSSRVYELFDTDFLRLSAEIYKGRKYQPEWRHFFLYLEWENVALHALAKSMSHDSTTLG
ncbi:hypothetical protein ACMA5I_14050 [Paracoccaceae bacterium GXU_MW_L88]